MLKPIWLYGIQLWGICSKSNMMRIQRVQNKILRVITDAPWFARNDEIHQYLEMPTVFEEIGRFCKKHKERLAKHPNHLASSLLVAPRVKRLKRADVLDN
ncbi:jg10159 [Pararge aegeria aegeria]|uniref:Jg10159 protein n=1 Tax=Pararge aegeria aegeria TaxID=348720 RepID=A0A8S4QRA8_9NEOP|nr:jg5665 [Pararge aegeria aegeria]CAH2232598.1 jg10159 [Pararge aegeria aegeria]